MADLDLDISTFIEVTQNGHGFVAGDVLYRTSGSYALAQADAEATSQVVGIVVEVPTVNTFTLALEGHKINGLSGFTDGSTYYLSDTTAGGMTSTPPSSPNYIVPVCIAVSTTSVVVGNLVANIRVRGLNAEFFDTDLVEPVFAKIYRSGASNGRFSLIDGNGFELAMEAGDRYIMFTQTDVVISSDTDAGNPNLNIGPGAGSNAMAFTVNGYEGLVFSIDKHGVIAAANLSGTNTGDETAQRIGNLINAATAKTTPVDADQVGLMDSAAGNILKKLSWLNVKATLKTYFDTLYPSGSGTSTGTNTGDQTSVTGNAGTATALQTSRNIDGQAFDGTANITVIAPGTNAAASKATPVDADELPLVDSAAANVLKKLTWANLKATLKTYLDALYISSTIVAAKGDIIGASANDTPAITSVGTDGQSLQAASGAASGLAWAWHEEQLLFFNSSTTCTNIPAAVQFLGAAAAAVRSKPVSLGGKTQVRLFTYVGAAGNASAKSIVRYRTSYSATASDYSILGASSVEVACSLAAGTQWVDSGWIDIVAAAKTDVYLASQTIDGDGAADPIVQQVVLWTR